MHPTTLQKMFRRVEKDLGHLFADEAAGVIDETRYLMMASYKRYQEGQSRTWGYTIHSERPIKFRQSQRPVQDNQVDLYCNVQWTDDDLPVEQDIKIRVWGLHQSLMFRDDLDAVRVQEELTNPDRKHKGRVISRYHFDRVNRHDSGEVSEEYHPTFHLQIGGKSLHDELCWHPQTFDIPRIPHHPMDFFLVCQLIAINFFPSDYHQIRENAEWIEQVSSTQRTLLEQYYRKCLECIKAGDSLLDMLVDH